MKISDDLKVIDENIDDIKHRMAIDQYDLINECQRQPALYSDVGDVYVMARSLQRRCKDEVDVVKAKLDIDIRVAADAAGGKKPTESSIASLILMNPEYKIVCNNLRDAEERAEALGILLASIAQRKSMIRDIVTLFISEYAQSVAGMKGDEKNAGKIARDNIARHRQQKANEKKEEQDSEDDKD